MAGRSRAVLVTLTIKRRRKLEQIIAAGTSPQRLVLRAKIVLAAAAGTANAAIGRQLGCSVAVVRTWRGRFAVRGIPGLFDRPRCGRPEVHGPSVRLAVIAVATSVPPDGESQWSRSLIAGHLRERGPAISAATVGRVLAEAKVRPHKVRGWLNRADDPGFWLRAGQVCRLYLDPPPGTVLISVDEKTGIQAKSRKHPEIPGWPGRDARREFEYVRSLILGLGGPAAARRLGIAQGMNAGGARAQRSLAAILESDSHTIDRRFGLGRLSPCSFGAARGSASVPTAILRYRRGTDARPDLNRTNDARSHERHCRRQVGRRAGT
jgi:hypothetical protein